MSTPFYDSEMHQELYREWGKRIKVDDFDRIQVANKQAIAFYQEERQKFLSRYPGVRYSWVTRGYNDSAIGAFKESQFIGIISKGLIQRCTSVFALTGEHSWINPNEHNVSDAMFFKMHTFISEDQFGLMAQQPWDL
jgi:hypothetical protein